MFTLDKKLQEDTFFVCDLKVSKLLLMNNANYPWLILVPRKNDLVELTDLDFAEQTEVLREINLVAEILQKKFKPHKLNIAALGNVVRQLHIHVIVRFENDNVFPKPVFGDKAIAYSENEALQLIEEIKSEINNG
ncbi:MAG: HIT family protein [Rickettsiales bacterium]|nr:HIT family protein [Rickettsiales bacterium]